MAVLTVALACLAMALPVLVYARLQRNGENSGALLLVGVHVCSYLLGAGVALLLLSGMLHWREENGVLLSSDRWHTVVLAGAISGLTVHLLLRIVFHGLYELAIHWALHLPRERNQTPALRLRSVVWEMVGFAAGFAVLYLLGHYARGLGDLGVWLLLPVFAAAIPLYETLLLPWLRFLRAPHLTTRNVADIDDWLDDVCRKRQIPRFHVKVQEGTLANAYAMGGLYRHLIVLGGGLLDSMTPSQIRAILAHEMAHVIRGDVPRLLLPIAIASGSCWLACVWHYASPLFATQTVSGVLSAAGIAALSAAVFTIAIPGYFMRRMEYGADRLAVELLGNGDLLVDALRRLAALNGDPIRQGYWSHPSTLDRIKAIRNLTANASV